LTREEFATLALSYLEDITAYARRLAADATDADDLVQATFERAFRSFEELRAPAACRAWLFRIARNLFIDSRRSTASRRDLRLVEDAAFVPPALTVPAETVERLTALELEDALARLPQEQRDIVLLCDLWGFEYAEIAEIMDVPIGTVRSRIARARVRLAALLGSGKSRRRSE
jgi:RNA polymerase sigma factor (sigma-70 family)